MAAKGRPLREPAAAVERRLGRGDGDVPRQPVRQPEGSRCPTETDRSGALRHAARHRPARHLVGTRDDADRDRRPPRADRSRLERARLALRLDRPAPLVHAAHRAVRAAADRRGRHLARSLRSPGPHGRSPPSPRCRLVDDDVRRAAGDRRAPRLLGRARIAHRRGRLVGPDAGRGPGDRLRARAPRVGAHGAVRSATARCGPATRSSAHATAPTSRATPASSPACATSARAWARSTSR